MGHSEELLGLIREFPQAFADPEDRQCQRSSCQDDKLTGTKTQQLLQLMPEFLDAFADPEAEKLESTPADQGRELTPSNAQVTEAPLPDISSLTPGYAYALRRRVQTLTWGQVDFDLVYGSDGLAEIWTRVGKSGTETQSLAEAIARLINLLLARQVPIAEIVRQIRGIRGADSEGLGPNRILGLADLIGKVLQEAPGQGQPPLGTTAQEDSPQASQVLQADQPAFVSGMILSSPQNTNLPNQTVTPPSISAWLSNGGSDQQLSTRSVCPDCGAELNQVNGCKGGACLGCGYSSCS